MIYILLLNFFISSFLLSLIIMTQVINYPLFYKVYPETFSLYHSSYVNKISFIAAPMMISEIIISILLLILIKSYLAIATFLLVCTIFLTTLFLQVPIHEKLKFKADDKLFKKLISTNWIRTFLWFVKCIISFNMVLKEII